MLSMNKVEGSTFAGIPGQALPLAPRLCISMRDLLEKRLDSDTMLYFIMLA